MLSTKSLVAYQKARLPIALASLNNGHSSNLRAYCTGVRSSSKPNLVPVRPLCLRSATWRSSIVTNFNITAPGRVPTTRAEAHAIVGRCRVVVMTLARNFIWPCNSFMLSRCTNSFLVSPSLASKPMRRRLNLYSSCLGASARVSTTRLTT